MQYALVDGVRSEATPGRKGICDICKRIMVAKCGPRIIHHWAHHRLRNCDPWWENETEWHRNWKKLFPEECREIPHIDERGEIHRADVKTSSGIYIEFQHSSMTDEERISREKFYKNLVWVIDGIPFEENFYLLHALPESTSEVAKDLVWSKAKKNERGTSNGIFWRISENPDPSTGHWLDTTTDKESLLKYYRGDHQYDWVRPRKTWLDATCPVYLDFGKEHLFRLETYHQPDGSNLKTVRLVAKEKFLHDVITEATAKAIGTKFYPITPKVSCSP